MTRNVITDVLPRPERLLLVWRPYEQEVKERGHWAVAEVRPVAEELHRPNDSALRKNDYNRTLRLVLRYFRQDGAGSEFRALNGSRPDGSPRSLEQLRELGYFGYPAFDEGKEEHNDGVLDAFLRRVPPLQRSDFEDYLKQYRLAPELRETLRQDPYLMLARTGAVTPNDNFRLIDPLENFSHGKVLLEVQGYRHKVEALKKVGKELHLGDTVTLQPDDENSYDPNAVKLSVSAGNMPDTERNRDIGYVCRFQAPALRRLLKTEQKGECAVDARIARLNGRPDSPKAYILLTVGKHQ